MFAFRFSKSWLLWALTLICSQGCINKGLENIPTKSIDSLNLDGLEYVPEWLAVLADDALPAAELNVWVPANNFQFSSLLKIPRFPKKYDTAVLKKQPNLKDFDITLWSQKNTLILSAIKNEQVSAQIVVAARRGLSKLRAHITTLTATHGDTIGKENVQIRFVKYIPVQRGASEYLWSAKYEEVAGEEVSGSMNPDVVADPLVKLPYVNVPAFRAQPIWFTFKIPKNTKPGKYSGTITLNTTEYSSLSYPISLEISDYEIQDPHHYSFHLNLWHNPYAIANFHKLEPWSPQHWQLLKKYTTDLASRGVKSITATIIDDPWKIQWTHHSMRAHTWTGYESMVKWIFTDKNEWKFDYTVFDEYVKVSMQEGLTDRINVFSMTVFRGKERITYFDERTRKTGLKALDIQDAEYKKIWSIFLKDFRDHLRRKNWLDKTYLCFDERSHEILNAALQVVYEAAPEFMNRITIAGRPQQSVIAENLSISFEFFPGEALEDKETLSVIKKRNHQGKLTTFYLCGQPDHPNSFSYSPAIESQLIPWLALKYNINGYLRWAYCNWSSDPYVNPVFYYVQGDDYLVYPGKDGPISSIRWELLKEGIEDYELFQIAHAKKKSNPTLQKAIELATRNTDGRHKEISDLYQARHLVLETLRKN